MFILYYFVRTSQFLLRLSCALIPGCRWLNATCFGVRLYKHGLSQSDRCVFPRGYSCKSHQEEMNLMLLCDLKKHVFGFSYFMNLSFNFSLLRILQMYLMLSQQNRRLQLDGKDVVV